MMSTSARSAAPVMRSPRVTADTFRQPPLTHFSALRRKILRAALAVRPFFYLIRTKTSAPINRLHFNRISLEKGIRKCSDK